jgi:hypothetical protein
LVASGVWLAGWSVAAVFWLVGSVVADELAAAAPNSPPNPKPAPKPDSAAAGGVDFACGTAFDFAGVAATARGSFLGASLASCFDSTGAD